MLGGYVLLLLESKACLGLVGLRLGFTIEHVQLQGTLTQVIDELLADSSDEEMLHSEKQENTSKNGQTPKKVNSNGTVTCSSIETFPNTGFRTSPPDPTRPHHRPLPSLQRIVKSEPEQPRPHPAPSQIECVDLCSSDED